MRQKALTLPPKLTLGKRLEAAMKVRGLKAPTLAAKTGLTRQAIYKLVKDRVANPDSGVVMALCDELFIRVEWLLAEKGSMIPSPELTDDESTLIYAYRDLGAEDKRKLLKIATTLATEIEGPPSRHNPFK
jgi:transcriptional regulator with XRE-family HTH domain